MCGRFALQDIPKPLVKEFDIEDIPPFDPKYNIAPSQSVPVILTEPGKKPIVKLLSWGLIPSWSKKENTNRPINARVETIEEKPMFKNAFKSRRCLIPADGFYEWKKSGKSKQPFYITPKKENFFTFAGIWEKWKSPDENEILSFAIITTDASPAMRNVHHRMPLAVPKDFRKDWLEIGSLSEKFKTASSRFSNEIKIIPVSTYVNNPKNEGPQCIRETKDLF